MILGKGPFLQLGEEVFGSSFSEISKMPSPGPDFSFRLSGHFLPLTHLSGGQQTPCRSVWVSPEASAGLTSVQPCEMQGWLGISGRAGLSWESSQKRSTEFFLFQG